jgi:hypothetical protein
MRRQAARILAQSAAVAQPNMELCSQCAHSTLTPLRQHNRAAQADQFDLRLVRLLVSLNRAGNERRNPTMLRINLIRRLIGVFVITIALGVGHAASADPILPGFDLFATRPGTFANLPGIGVVAFMGGQPLIPGTNTDTIVERLQGIDPFDPPNGEDTIEIILRELSLQSVAPVNINGTFFNITVTEADLQEVGSMRVRHLTDDGGDFTSRLPINALLTFTPVGGGMPFTMNFSTILMSACTWSHTRPDNYPIDPRFPSGGFFPTGQCFEVADTGNEAHVVEPAQVPEPTALLLLASGLTGVAGFYRKRLSGKT